MGEPAAVFTVNGTEAPEPGTRPLPRRHESGSGPSASKPRNAAPKAHSPSNRNARCSGDGPAADSDQQRRRRLRERQPAWQMQVVPAGAGDH